MFNILATLENWEITFYFFNVSKKDEKEAVLTVIFMHGKALKT